jgi:hypothetical protein
VFQESVANRYRAVEHWGIPSYEGCIESSSRGERAMINKRIRSARHHAKMFCRYFVTACNHGAFRTAEKKEPETPASTPIVTKTEQPRTTMRDIVQNVLQQRRAVAAV